MGFSDKQTRALARGVPRRAIRSRLRAGRELSYIEGWYVVSQANRIFGFDGWDRETVETKCIMAREARGTVTAIYSARVRITVRTGDAVIIRDGHGTGEAHGDSAGEVHDRALKAPKPTPPSGRSPPSARRSDWSFMLVGGTKSEVGTPIEGKPTRSVIRRVPALDRREIPRSVERTSRVSPLLPFPAPTPTRRPMA